MYRLTKDGNEIALVNTMNYIHKQTNGVYGLCNKSVADGVVADNTVYHFGSDIDSVEYVDGADEIKKQAEEALSILRGEVAEE